MLIPNPSPASVRPEKPEGKRPLVVTPREITGSNFKIHPESIISYYFFTATPGPSHHHLSQYLLADLPDSTLAESFIPNTAAKVILSKHKKISHSSAENIARTLHFTHGKKAKCLQWPSRPCVMLPNYYSVLFSYCVPTCPPFPGPPASLPSTSLPLGLCSNVPFAHNTLSLRESLGSLPLLFQAYL